jgi:SAM-dependent methyltransferase
MAAGGFKQRVVELAHNLGVATHRFLSPNPHGLVQVALSHPDLLRVAREVMTQMPQAALHDDTVKICESGDWRSYFAGKLSGTGLEIGALHRPLPTHSGMTVRYVDCVPYDELLRMYDTLDPRWKKLIVTPDIIDDGGTLKTVPDASYDFVVSSHLIEHLPDPISGISHWCRVLRPGGLLYLTVPDKRASFDSRRVRTTLEHLILDYQRPSAERDFEHYLEYALHVHRASGDKAIEEADRLLEEQVSIHYHVFQPADIVALLGWFNTHVRPVEIVEGPVVDPFGLEFHLLIAVR